MKELNFHELSPRQKIGMTMVAAVRSKESFEFALDLVKKRSLGAIWINPAWDYEREAAMKAFKEAADYPILFVTDAESGLGEHQIGRHNAIGCTDSEELAYTFGKVTAIEARKLGVNMVCNPVLDMVNGNFVCGANIRSLGNDKHKVVRPAAAEAQGLRDGGVLTLAKHFPGSSTTGHIDSHMAETGSDATLEELFDYNLYPYKILLERGLLDGVMVRHTRFFKIDDQYPASLSRKVTGIIRDMGFDGLCMTDALNMMGVLARFDREKVSGLAINAGNDLALPFEDSRTDYENLCKFYDEGLMDEEMLNAAVKRVLAAQHKVLSLPQDAQITPEDEENFARISADSVYARTDDGVAHSISKEGRHFFAILTPHDYGSGSNGEVPVDTLEKGWYRPKEIISFLSEKFPNSVCFAISEFPNPTQSWSLLDKSLGYDDVIFITYFQGGAYIGQERFTPRILSLMDAMQRTERISTVIHYGNPYVLEDLPHFSRVLIGTASADGVRAGLRVLAGEYPAKGSLTYDITLK